MNRTRRFAIFFAAAATMTVLLLLTRSAAVDDTESKGWAWLPGNRVISSVLERIDAQGKAHPKVIKFTAYADSSMKALGVTRLEVIHNLRDGDVEFSHDKSKPRNNPKRYYISEEILGVTYFVVAEIQRTHTEIIEFGKAD